MNIGTISAAALLVIAILGCHRSEGTLAPAVKQDAVHQKVDDRPKEAILSILRGGGSSAILEIRGYCLDARTISFALRVNTTEHESKGVLEKLRASLKGNPDLTFTEERNGIIVVSSDSIDRGLLQTRMQRVNLSETEQYDPNDALLAILGTNEVRDYMNQHSMSLAPQLNGLRAAPSPELPHVAPHFDDLTVEQFERTIVKIFPGIVIYQECSMPDGQRLVSFEADRIAVKQKR